MVEVSAERNMSKRILYLECNTGISGDMLVAALLDAGADEEVLRKAVSGIGDGGFEIKISRVKKSGLDCCDFDVILDKEHENHDHDMEYLYGHDGKEHRHEHGHDHSHNNQHEHDHSHSHSHNNSNTENHANDHSHEHDHAHEHRNPEAIKKVINALDMTDEAKNIAFRTFDILAEAEAKAHGVTVDEVHFHEVGAIDSIVDIVSAAVLLDNLKVDEVIVKEIREGIGFVRCQHGIIPVPVPAVSNISAAYGIPLKITDREGEFVTPTGAAFIAAVMTGSALPDDYRIKRIGMGAGKREYNPPSIVRAMILETSDGSGAATKAENKSILNASLSDEVMSPEQIWKLESDIDDSTGEQLGYVMEKLFEAGAREVHYNPIFMKKNRPGWELSVITDDEHLEVMEQIIFKETTTIGIRRQKMERSCLPRRIEKVNTDLGEVRVKVCTIPDGSEKRYPEYDDVKMLAEKNGKSFEEVFRKALLVESK